MNFNWRNDGMSNVGHWLPDSKSSKWITYRGVIAGRPIANVLSDSSVQHLVIKYLWVYVTDDDGHGEILKPTLENLPLTINTSVIEGAPSSITGTATYTVTLDLFFTTEMVGYICILNDFVCSSPKSRNKTPKRNKDYLIEIHAAEREKCVSARMNNCILPDWLPDSRF